MLKNIQTKIYIAIGALVLLLLTGLCIMQQEYIQQTEGSQLYQAESAYRLEGKTWEELEGIVFVEDSAEAIFLQGVELFTAEEYAEAEKLFQQALTASGSDVTLPAYLQYYSNLCLYEQEEAKNWELLSKCFDALAQYPLLANDTELLWNLIGDSSFSAEENQNLIALLQKYLENTENLTRYTAAWLQNGIGMFYYHNEEYANAIRTFYDVELMLADVDLTATADVTATEEEINLASELRYAKESIANIYYTFEAYEQAAELYWELAEAAVEDEIFYEYSSCLNMLNVCLEYGNIEGAKKAIALLERGMPNVEANKVEELEAHRYDGLANICMEEGNYSQADQYLKKAEAYYQYREATEEIFFGGQHFVQLSRCEYMVHTGQLSEAQARLEEMNAAGTAKYADLEKDVYKLLEEIYLKTGQTEKLIGVYQYLQKYDEEFTKTVQREYLEFSKYYRENNELKEYNIKLSNDKNIAIGIAGMIFCILLLVLLLVRLLNTKNVTDQLTGVYNRKMLDRMMRKYQKVGTPANLGVAMMDIDFFKRYNDTYGHPAGDMVLKEVARILKTSVRKQDTVIRYGGEEFLLLLNDVQQQTAEEICKRIQKNLTERALLHEASMVADYVTLSIGVCYQQKKAGAGLKELIAAADACLYQSKENGRNRVTMKSSEQI